jgi:hypothetical protein
VLIGAVIKLRLGSCKTGFGPLEALVTEKGQNAPAVRGRDRAIAPKTSPAETVEQRITPEIRPALYAFLPLILCEEVKGFFEGKIGKAGEHQRGGSDTKTAYISHFLSSIDSSNLCSIPS